MKKNLEEQALEFSKRLKHTMNEMHITATELSNATGIGKSDISNYMRGKYMPKQDRIYKMASVLKVSPVWLGAFDMAIEKEANMLDTLLGNSKQYHHIVSTEPWDVDAAFAEQKDSPIYQMARGMSKLSPENQQKLIDVAKTLFGKDFTEEGDKK